MTALPLAQCGVCFEDYHHEDTDRQPQVLSRCGHSFCAACVRGLIRNHPHDRRAAVCPICKHANQPTNHCAHNCVCAFLSIRRETSQSDVHINYDLRDIVQQLRTATAAAPAPAPSNTTHSTPPAVPPTGQEAPLTARQRQEAADYALALQLSNEINDTDPPSNQTPFIGGGAPLRRRTGTLPSSGYPYEVVQEGTGRVPTLNDTVKFYEIWWRDRFDGRDKRYDLRGAVYRVSDLYGWLRELFLSMREGEVRHIKVPDGPEPYRELRLISIE